MTTAIVTTSAGAIASADNDQMLVDLFIATKRSPHTASSMATAVGCLPVSLTSRYRLLPYRMPSALKAQYSAGSVRLHVNVAKDKYHKLF